MIQETLAYLHILAIAVLVGKVVFLSFVTAPVLARTLDPESFARVVRQLFPRYYALGMVSAVVGWATITALAILRGFSPFDLVSSALWLGILMIENYCRAPLTPLDIEVQKNCYIEVFAIIQNTRGLEKKIANTFARLCNALSDRLKENQARGLNTPLIQKRRDTLHNLTVQLNSAVLVMGLCLIGLI